MLDRDQPKNGAWWSAARTTAGAGGIVRVNADVLEHRGYQIWLSIDAGAGSRLPAVVRRLCAGRASGRDPCGQLAVSPLLNDAMLGASRAGTQIATIALRMDSPAGGLRADARHAGVIDALRREGRCVCELDRLALDQMRDCATILRALFELASLYAGEVRGATDLVIETHPLQAEIYRRLFGFTRASTEMPHTRLGASSVLLRLDLACAQEPESAGSGEPLGTDRLDDFRLDPEEKKEAARRMHAMFAGACRRVAGTESAAGQLTDAVAAVEKPSPTAIQPVSVAQFEPHTYDDGLRAGVQARLRSAPITPYQRVGLDDFARGFRAGYFSSRGSHVGNTLGGRAAS